jgi:WD40 repeat protein
LDRTTYENVSSLNKEIYELANVSLKLPPPWPETFLLKPKTTTATTTTNTTTSSSGIKCVTFSSSSKAVACGCHDGSVCLWTRQNGKKYKLNGRPSEKNIGVSITRMEVLAIAFSPNEKYLAVGNADTTIQIWILDSGSLIPTGDSFTLHDEVNQSSVHSLSFFRNSNVLASAGHDSYISFWDLSTRQHIGVVPHPEKVESISVSPNGKTMTSSTWDGTVRIFEVDDSFFHSMSSGNDTVLDMKILGKGLPLTEVQWSQDGSCVHGLKGFRLRKWRVENPGDCICLSGRRVNRICSIALSPQGHRVAYAERDGTIRISTLASAYYKADITRTLYGHSDECSMTFSPDGRCLVSGSSDGSLRLWNIS